MTVLSAQTIHERVYSTKWRRENGHEVNKALSFLITPYVDSKKSFQGMSYGLTGAGYDIRLGKLDNGLQSAHLKPGDFLLAASLEEFEIPHDLQAIVHDKSTLARQGVALQNTVLEPGWKGFITLELSNHGPKPVRILVGQPIAQVVFHVLDVPTNVPYSGKYQHQSSEPTPAKFEGDPLMGTGFDDGLDAPSTSEVHPTQFAVESGDDVPCGEGPGLEPCGSDRVPMGSGCRGEDCPDA